MIHALTSVMRATLPPLVLGAAAGAQALPQKRPPHQDLGARVWSVDPADPGAFSDVQPAIDAARSGDVVLVAPGHTYRGFTLDKGIGIRVRSGSFAVDGPILIENIPDVQRATVMGFQQQSVAGEVWLRDSAGEVVLEEFTILGTLRIEDCHDVCADRSVVTGTTGPAITILRSTVSLSEVDARGGTAAGLGAPAVAATESMVTLGGPVLKGGNGVDDGSGNGAAGPAVFAQASTLFVIGTEAHSLAAGDLTLGPATAAHAAPSLELPADAHATVSRVHLEGTAPRMGMSSSLTFHDSLPYLSAPGDIRLGENVPVQVDGRETGLAYVTFASAGTQTRLFGYVGPNWSLSDAGNLCIVPLRTDALGDVNEPIPVPTYDAYLAVPIKAQVALIADDGSRYTSNTVVRTMGSQVP